MINLKNDEENNSSCFLLRNGGHIGVYDSMHARNIYYNIYPQNCSFKRRKNVHMYKTYTSRIVHNQTQNTLHFTALVHCSGKEICENMESPLIDNYEANSSFLSVKNSLHNTQFNSITRNSISTLYLPFRLYFDRS